MASISEGAMLIAKYPGASVAAGAASASVAMPTDSEGKQPKWIFVSATTASWVRLTKGASTAVAGDLLVNGAGSGVLLNASQFDTISALQVTTAGTVGITVVENF